MEESASISEITFGAYHEAERTLRSAANDTIVRCFSLVIWFWFRDGSSSLYSVDENEI